MMKCMMMMMKMKRKMSKERLLGVEGKPGIMMLTMLTMRFIFVSPICVFLSSSEYVV